MISPTLLVTAGSAGNDDPFRDERTAATFAYTAIEMFLKNGVQMADLLMSGILPRFSNLQFVSVESGIGWIPYGRNWGSSTALVLTPDA